MRTGIISDTHFPAEHPGALAFVLDIFYAWDIEQVMHIGDVAELHNPSFHDNHPEMPGPKDEWEHAQRNMQEWDVALRHAGFVTAQRRMKVCIGNHDNRPLRVAEKYGVASPFMATYNQAWGMDWDWADEHIIDDVLYMHGHQKCGGGEHPAHLTLKKGLDISVVLGHYHTKGGINPLPGRRSLRWGMDVGCLVDRLHPAMKYAESGSMKQMISIGVVIDQHPFYEMMPCGPGQQYHRSKFKKKSRK